MPNITDAGIDYLVEDRRDNGRAQLASLPNLVVQMHNVYLKIAAKWTARIACLQVLKLAGLEEFGMQALSRAREFVSRKRSPS